MHRLAIRRGRAYALDAVGYLGIAVAMAPLGVLAYRAGWGDRRGYTLAVSAVPPVLAALLAAGQESGRLQATWGKRRCRLRIVAGQDSTVGFGRALVRNLVKITVPWQLGHVVVIGAVRGGLDERDVPTLTATALVHPVIGVLIAGVLLGQGRAVHDRLAGTTVVSCDLPLIGNRDRAGAIVSGAAASER